jgi:hypothetical protein
LSYRINEMLKYIILITIYLIQLFSFSHSTFDEIIVYKNEINDTFIEVHIIYKTLSYIENEWNYAEISALLSLSLNLTYGYGWQVISGYNANFSTIDVMREEKSLFYFSFRSNHFYVFKQQINDPDLMCSAMVCINFNIKTIYFLFYFI